MARLVFGMLTSIDGYVDHEAFNPAPALFRHFIEQTRGLAGSLYGRRLYEIMQYWDEDQPEWDDAEHEFAAVWRAQPKWVASRTLAAVGPNATLIEGDLGTAVRRLKAEVEGDLDVGGTVLAQALGELGLIDAYRLYVNPVVLGSGTPYFAGRPPPLRLVESEAMEGGVVRLAYEPAPPAG